MSGDVGAMAAKVSISDWNGTPRSIADFSADGGDRQRDLRLTGLRLDLRGERCEALFERAEPAVDCRVRFVG